VAIYLVCSLDIQSYSHFALSIYTPATCLKLESHTTHESMKTQVSTQLMRYTLLSFGLLASLRHTIHLVQYVLVQKQKVEIYSSIYFSDFSFCRCQEVGPNSTSGQMKHWLISSNIDLKEEKLKRWYHLAGNETFHSNSLNRQSTKKDTFLPSSSLLTSGSSPLSITDESVSLRM
jgi:hypothetical protein